MSLDLDAIVAKVVPSGDVVADTVVDLFGVRRQPGPIVISSGLGRDSTTIVALMLEGVLPVGNRLVGPEDVAAVVFSDTGYEWSKTRDLIPVMRQRLAVVGVPFYELATPPEELWRPWWGQRRQAWLAAFAKVEQARRRGDVATANRLWEQLARPAPRGQIPWQPPELLRASIADKARLGYYHGDVPLLERVLERSRPIVLRRAGGGRSAECTDRHKIQPIRRFLADLAASEVPSIRRALDETEITRGTVYLQRRDQRGHRIRADDALAALKLYAADVQAGQREPIKLLIGYAADETSRVQRGTEGRLKAPEYVQIGIEELYPLVEAGIGKKQEGAILRRHGLDWVIKSGCVFCPESPSSWFWALSEWDPPIYKRLVQAQQAALRRNPKFTWLGGKKTLPEVVAAWRERNPNATVDAVLSKNYTRCGAFNRCSSCS